MALGRSIAESPSYGNPAGFQNVVIPCMALTDGDTITMLMASETQWFGSLTDQQVFGAKADAAPTGDIFAAVGNEVKPVYFGSAVANGVIAAGDYFQICYDVVLDAFHLLNWSQPGSGGALNLTTIGTSGPATLVADTLNIPVYGDTGETVIIAGAGPVVVLADDGLIILNKTIASATSIILPDVALRNGLPLVIVDWAGNAGDITLTPSGAELIMGLPQAVLASTGQGAGSAAAVTLLPSVDINGWVFT